MLPIELKNLLLEQQEKSNCTEQPCKSCLDNPCCLNPGHATYENTLKIYELYKNGNLKREDETEYTENLSYKEFVRNYFDEWIHPEDDSFILFYPKTLEKNGKNFGCIFNKRAIKTPKDNFKNCLLWSEDRFDKITTLPLGCITNGGSKDFANKREFLTNYFYSNSRSKFNMEKVDTLSDDKNIVSSNLDSLKVDSWVKENMDLTEEDEELLKYSMVFDNGQTDYSSQWFVTGQSITDYKKIQQCFMELETRYNSYKKIVRNLREAEVKIKILNRKIEAETDELEKELLMIDYDDLTYDAGYFKRKMGQCEREIKGYLKLIKDNAKTLENAKKAIEHNPEEERKYWTARMAKQCAMDIIAYGRIGSGNMESLLLMDERDQLDTLKNALGFAGKLNTTIGKMNDALESDFKNFSSLDHFQMPQLELNEQSHVAQNEKNLLGTSESKTDGFSI